jgi:hypothetical protein
MQANATIPFTTIASGNFTLAHNLGLIPTTVIIEPTASGSIWFQNPRYDATNLYLVASGSGITGVAIVYANCGGC